MQTALNQVKHNESFYVCICENYADNFFDWKITVCFYIAVHYLKALAAKQGVVLARSHYDIEKQANPDKRNELSLTKNAWNWYFNLYLTSRVARYEGFAMDAQTFKEIKKADHEMCEKFLNRFRSYMKGKGIVITP